ncbi:hypothetical protein OS493_018689 [Desmophyllum pertusum]|uniref:SUEL-type lectin domain-containing protein n=1 Tax=Desmophyllum pertusum TaxID=174260 RepID=A0A9W9ZPB5_9CNID|nr:hypothetical protein OS493_018689 [Desmophyllum pertusum]
MGFVGENVAMQTEVFILNVTVVCAGERALLQCNTGKRVKVTQARWGGGNSVTCANSASAADSTSMPLIADTDSSPVTDQIRKRCAKQQNCKVEASRPFFESVPSTSKYLKVWHECIPDVSRVILPTRKTKENFASLDRVAQEALDPSRTVKAWELVLLST